MQTAEVDVSSRLGHCVICGNRVSTDESYLKASEGYCHHKCLSTTATV